MSLMKDERTETTKQNNFYPDNLNSNAKDKNYYNLNIATFTFGGKQEDRAQLIKSPFDKESLLKDNITINNINQRRNNSMRHLSDPSWKQDSQRNATKDDLTRTSYGLKSNQDNNVINVKGQHDSFLSAVIRCIWNMKIFRNFILNELPTIIENDNRPKLISSLKLLFVDYAVDKPLDLHRIRKALALLFQSRRKFLIDHPDDPVDCYFSIVNAIHCNYMKSSLNELVDDSCNSRCFSHKSLWMDLIRIEECECGGVSKRLFSNHHYILDIPIERIIDLASNMNLIEMNKSFKLKTGKFSEVGTKEILSTSDLKGKLFLYYKMLLNQATGDCPVNGTRCKFNKTKRNLFISNSPKYLAFSILSTNLSFTITDIMKTFVLFPKIFDLSTLLEHQRKEKVFYEFLGAILVKQSKSYSSFFKNDDSSWLHYDEDNVRKFGSWFDLVTFCVKNGEIPSLLLYHTQEKYVDGEKELTLEEIQNLERYAKNADNLSLNYKNRLRLVEDIILFESLNTNETTSNNVLTRNDPCKSSTKSSTTLSTSKNNSITNSNSRIDQGCEYHCYNCNSKNRIEAVMCFKCGRNNEEFIDDLLRRRHSNIQNLANDSASDKGNINVSNKGKFGNPFNKGPLYDHCEQDNVIRTKNLDMPKQIAIQKEQPVAVFNSRVTNRKEEKEPTQKSEKKKIRSVHDYEDRIKPYDNKTHSNSSYRDLTLCICGKKLQDNEQNCTECKVNVKRNSSIKKRDYNSNKEKSNTPDLCINSNYNSIRSSHYDNLDRKSSSKRNLHLEKEYETENNKAKKRHLCICYMNFNDSCIKNKICTVCNRHIDNESSIKKKYQEKETSVNPSRLTNPKTTKSIPKEDNETKQNLTNYRSPSVSSKKKASTRYVNDITDNEKLSHNDSNYIRTLKKDESGLQLKTNPQSRLNSSSKKKLSDNLRNKIIGKTKR